MELGNQIKLHRAALSLSQEELAEKVYVTRQTVSNWETGKSYPDIHSLLLLSALFDVSLDQLIKGDLETMKQEVNAADVKAMNRDAIIYTVLLAATIILPVPLVKWLGLYGLIRSFYSGAARCTLPSASSASKRQTTSSPTKRS